MKALLRQLNSVKTLCFLDLEGTQFSHEMIALGAVKVNIRKDGSIKKIHRGYYTLVKAKNKVGKVVTDLTGITDNELKKNGVPFRVAVANLKKYMGRDFTKCKYITFGNHDLRIIAQSLAYNLDVKKEDVQILIKHHFDFSEFASSYVKDENNNNYSLANFLKVFNVEFKGEQHNALADALNLVYLYDALLKRKDILKIEYTKVLAKQRHLPEPVHNVLNDLLNDKTVTKADFEKYVEESLKWSNIQTANHIHQT